jgi:large subunit ribosomal protein L23
MNNERLYQILLGPVFSEKAQRLGDKLGVQVFKVAPNATKLEIKKAVEQLFGVEVQAVNTVSIRGKTKRFGKTVGRRSTSKKHTSRSKQAKTSSWLILLKALKLLLRNKDENHAYRKM